MEPMDVSPKGKCNFEYIGFYYKKLKLGEKRKGETDAAIEPPTKKFKPNDEKRGEKRKRSPIKLKKEKEEGDSKKMKFK